MSIGEDVILWYKWRKFCHAFSSVQGNILGNVFTLQTLNDHNFWFFFSDSNGHGHAWKLLQLFFILQKYWMANE
jgi:hypothetical protein